MINLYVDMDNVLANFSKEKNGVERFAKEQGFFKRLKPIKSNVKAITELLNNDNYNVFILSASPNENADSDKIEWLKKYLPNLKKENIIIMRNGSNKADYVKTTENNVLVDDWSKNCLDFVKRGYSAYLIAPYKTIKRVLGLIK